MAIVATTLHVGGVIYHGTLRSIEISRNVKFTHDVDYDVINIIGE